MSRGRYAIAIVRRVAVVAAFTAWFLPTVLLARLAGSRSVARVVRIYFQRCGGGFVKLGQLLSTRYDLLPTHYCTELSALLDNAGAVDSTRILEVVERELGGPLTDWFAHFELAPLASASIAQVHAARLHPDIDVVVKVQRPDARVMFRVDFAALHLLARLLDVILTLGEPRFRAIIAEAHAALAEELDFRREARNCHRMHTLMQADSVRHYAPRVHFTHSSANVLTMERIRGVVLRDIIDAIDRDDRDQLAVWAEYGITPKRLARRVLISVLTQTMRHRFFQGDPHPANLIVRTDGSLAWVDFGMTGWMDDRTWIQQFRLRDAIARKDLHRAYEALLDTLEPVPAVDLRDFENSVETAMQDWIIASETPEASLVEKSSGYFLLRTFEAIRHARMTMPARLMRLYRTMMIADMVMLKLDPTINWLPILRRFVEVETRRQTRDLSSSPLLPSLVESLQAALRIPGASIRLVDWLNSRLPRYGRLYEREISVFDSAALAAVRLSRFVAMAVVAAAVVLVGARLVIPVETRSGGGIIRLLDEWRVAIGIGGFTVFVWASLAMRQLRR